MKLATIAGPTPDGLLCVVSSDNRHFVVASGIALTLQAALDDWEVAAPELQRLCDGLNCGRIDNALPVTGQRFLAPLPRAWQWLDGSAFDCHGELMARAFGMPAPPRDAPLMYQGVSNPILAPTADFVAADEAFEIDFEGEFGVIVGRTALGTAVEGALDRVRLLVLLNDWSLRAFAAAEMKTGFGWIHAKPPFSMAPFAITPDELGEDWRDGRICRRLTVRRNGKPFGMASGAEMDLSFADLISHAARTRDLCAGTIIGSGTVSNKEHHAVGSSCIAERRAIERMEGSESSTEYMRFGDTVEMECLDRRSTSLFGSIAQRVVGCQSDPLGGA